MHAHNSSIVKLLIFWIVFCYKVIASVMHIYNNFSATMNFVNSFNLSSGA